MTESLSEEHWEGGDHSSVYLPWAVVSFLLETQPPLQSVGSASENWNRSEHWSNDQDFIGAPVLSFLRFLLLTACGPGSTLVGSPSNLPAGTLCSLNKSQLSEHQDLFAAPLTLLLIIIASIWLLCF